MRLFARLMLVTLLGMFALPAHAAPMGPSRIQASYDVYKGNLRGATITETYTRTQDGYRIESVSKASGIVALIKPETIRVISQGQITPHGLRPTSYTNERKLDSERNLRADLDWDTQHITLQDRAGKRSVPLPADTQDRLSAMYQFLFMSLHDATTLDFHMTNGNKVDIYNFLVTRTQDVTVPLGRFKALYVASLAKSGESRTEIWLAVEHDNFPCKMVITDPDGGTLTQVLTRFELEP